MAVSSSVSQTQYAFFTVTHGYSLIEFRNTVHPTSLLAAPLQHFAIVGTLPATRSRYPLHKTSSLRWRLFSTIFSPPEMHIWFSSRKAAETKYLWSVSTNDNQEQQKPRIRILKILIFITVKYVEVRVCILHWVYVSQLDIPWYEYQV